MIQFEGQAHRAAAAGGGAGPDRQAGADLPRQEFKPKDLTPLKDLGGEGGKCMIWGDVFATEVKGNFRKIYSVSITDYTGSINLKIAPGRGGLLQVGGAEKRHHPAGAGRLRLRQVRARLHRLPLRRADRGAPPPGGPRPRKSGWNCTCTLSCPRWSVSATPAASSGWPTRWGTPPSPSPTTASARATPRPCWLPTTSTRRTPAFKLNLRLRGLLCGRHGPLRLRRAGPAPAGGVLRL